MHYSVSDFVLDLVQNAVEAGAHTIRLLFDEREDGLAVQVSDDGCGMDTATLQRALNPFQSGGAKHPGRKVGLGLPFLKQATEQAGGSFNIRSEPGKGTVVEFFFPAANVDSPPVGNPVSLFLTVLGMAGQCELKMLRRRARDGLSYEVSKNELEEAVGDLSAASSLSLVRQFLDSQEEG